MAKVFFGKNKLIILIILVIFFFIYASFKHGEAKNSFPNLNRSTQNAYLFNIRELRANNYKYFIERDRMPIYIYLQAILTSSDDEEECFAQGKRINILISAAALFIIAVVLFFNLNWLSSLNIFLITTFMVFLFYSPYLQCENLYYFFSFLLFLLILKTFSTPGINKGLLLGFLFAITYLTKASILPAFVLYCVIYFIKFVCDFIYNRSWQKVKKTLISLFFTVIIFFIMIYPYINNNKKVFDKYFYNVNSTYYFWCDNWQEALLTRNLNDRWEKVVLAGPVSPPSFQRYISLHYSSDVLERFRDGFIRIFNMSINSYGYFKYLILYMLFSLIGFILNIRDKKLVTHNIYTAGYVFSYFILYLLLYAWYTRISSPIRFILQLFLPLIFVLALINEYLYKDYFFVIYKKKFKYVNIFNIVLLVFLIFDICGTLMVRIITMQGGI